LVTGVRSTVHLSTATPTPINRDDLPRHAGSSIPSQTLSRRIKLSMTTHEATLQRAMNESVATSTFIACNLGTEADLNRTQRLAVASLCICLDHREATLLLASHGAWTSAFAMMRPTFEACVRGCWLGFVANDQQIDLLFAGRLSTKLETMARTVGKAEPALTCIESLASMFKDRLDDFTHGSGAQLARWYGPESVAPRHSSGEVIDVLRFVDSVGLIACTAREKLCGRPTAPFLSRLERAASPDRKSLQPVDPLAAA